jgi:hypothetical protein
VEKETKYKGENSEGKDKVKDEGEKRSQHEDEWERDERCRGEERGRTMIRRKQSCNFYISSLLKTDLFFKWLRYIFIYMTYTN